MKTNNPKIVGLVMLFFGIGMLLFCMNNLYKAATYYTNGTTTQATVVGYKISRNGAQMVKSSKSLAGKIPFFEFVTPNNQAIKSYSKSPQIVMFFNYEIGEKVTVAYPNNNPEKAILLSWKEIPGMLLLIGFGLLAIIVGKSYFFKK